MGHYVWRVPNSMKPFYHSLSNACTQCTLLFILPYLLVIHREFPLCSLLICMSQKALRYCNSQQDRMGKISDEGSHFQRLASTTATSLFCQGWKLIDEIWVSRNKQLHHNARIRDLSGLPHIWFQHHFRISLLPKSLECLKDWFIIIPSGPYAHDDSSNTSRWL